MCVLFPPGDLFEIDGERWLTAREARLAQVPSRFPSRKSDPWRAFRVGGSFAMGSPYTNQGNDREDAGWVHVVVPACTR